MKVIVAGGGTAGHINPGLSIASHIRSKQPGSEIIFIGTERGLEKNLVPRQGFELKLIKVRGFERSLSPKNLLTLKELAQGILQARSIIKKFKPDLVIGTGGYVCGPVLLMAASLGIPTMIHDQNAYPSFTNRVLSNFVDAVAISFKDTEKYFKRAKKLIFTGNPIRTDFLNTDRQKAFASFHFDENKPVVFITGGSQGARKLNQVSCGLVREALDSGRFQVLWATGDKNYEDITRQLDQNGLQYKHSTGIDIRPYIYNMNEAMAVTDLVVCRAGAITTAEVMAMGIPSILVPLPTAAANHQEHNAREIEKGGAAVVILEKDLTHELLTKQVKELLEDKEALSRMSRNARKMGVTDAADKLYQIAMDTVLLKKD